MYKMGDVAYEWVLFQVRDMGKVFGLVDVPKDLLTNDEKIQKNYKRFFTASIMVPTNDGGLLVEVSNPHQLLYSQEQGVKVAPINYGDRRITIRKDAILVTQIMDDTSPLVKAVISEMSAISKPGVPGETTTGAGIILSGSAAAAKSA